MRVHGHHPAKLQSFCSSPKKLFQVLARFLRNATPSNSCNILANIPPIIPPIVNPLQYTPHKIPPIMDQPHTKSWLSSSMLGRRLASLKFESTVRALSRITYHTGTHWGNIRAYIGNNGNKMETTTMYPVTVSCQPKQGLACCSVKGCLCYSRLEWRVQVH